MKKLLIISFVFLGFLTLPLFLNSNSLASSHYDQEAKKKGITFPVADLGNCGSAQECMQYCETPENREKCMNFAKKRGFSGGKEGSRGRGLPAQGGPGGCNSEESCRAYCDKSANQQTCIEWSEKNGYGGSQGGQRPSADKVKLMEDAKNELGCSGEECMKFCDNRANGEKCEAFARKHGLNRGEGGRGVETEAQQKIMTELGCSKEECRNFCENPANREKCFEAAKKYGMVKEETPPCNSPESCKAFCDQNPDRCKYERSPGEEEFKPQEIPVGPKCETREECEKFCRENPNRCSGFNPPQGESVNRTGPGGCNSEESCRAYCQGNPSACQGQGGERNNSSSNTQGPGGCNSQESCESYCRANPKECGMQRQEQERHIEPERQYSEQQNYNQSEPYSRPPVESSQKESNPTYSQPPSEPVPQEKSSYNQTEQFREGEFKQPTSTGEQNFESVRGVKTRSSQGFIKTLLDTSKLLLPQTELP